MRLKELFIIMTMSLAIFMGCKKDQDPGLSPVVASTDPINNALNFAVNNKITIVFNQEMLASSFTNSTFTLKHGSTTISGATQLSGKTGHFIPTADLSPNTVYTATVTTAVKNMEGNSLNKDYVWNFTTGAAIDNVKPTVTLTNPANNAEGVELNKMIVTTFSESMDASTITALTFQLKQGATSVKGAVSYTGMDATFAPEIMLLPNTIYTGTITADVKDMAGNSMAEAKTFSFTTGAAEDNTLPTVISTDPADNEIDVARNKVISFTFSETMDPLTIVNSTFILKNGNSIIEGIVEYSGNTGSFTPTVELDADMNYDATITTDAKDLAGNALAANVEWSFTTGSNIAVLDVVQLGSAGNYVILAKTAINNNPTSKITGDLGLSPAATSYITGFSETAATGYATSPQVTGKIYAADMADPTPDNLTTAVENMLTAYDDAAGRPFPDFSELGTGNIGGKTLSPGLYKWSSTVTLPTNVTILGGPNDVWIFQISGDLDISSAVKVTLQGGAQAKNIFWQVAGQATFGSTSEFKGVILSMTGITFQTGAKLDGRALAQTAVILDSNTITKP